MSLPLWDVFLNLGIIEPMPAPGELQFFDVFDVMAWQFSVKGSIVSEEIPSIAPPFPVFWMESRPPFGLPCSYGDYSVPKGLLGAAALFQYTPNGFGWKLHQIHWQFYRTPNFDFVGAERTISIDREGKIDLLTQTNVRLLGSHTLADHWSDEEIKNEAAKTVPFFNSFCMAVAFMHCKNVELRDAEPPPPKLVKKRARLGKPPFVEHKVLTIGKMREVLRAAGSQTDIKMALHLCRGHFKTYTPDAPLFGKHIGTYWHDAHVRGSEDVGKISKTYRVSP